MLPADDAEARLIAARQEGREEGRAERRQEGVLAGKIQLLQELLGEEPTDLPQLLLRSSEELEALVAKLLPRLGSVPPKGKTIT